MGSAFKCVFQLFQFPRTRSIHGRMEKSHNNKLEDKQNAIIAVIYLIFIFANLIEYNIL